MLPVTPPQSHSMPPTAMTPHFRPGCAGCFIPSVWQDWPVLLSHQNGKSSMSVVGSDGGLRSCDGDRVHRQRASMAPELRAASCKAVTGWAGEFFD